MEHQLVKANMGWQLTDQKGSLDIHDEGIGLLLRMSEKKVSGMSPLSFVRCHKYLCYAYLVELRITAVERKNSRLAQTDHLVQGEAEICLGRRD